LEPAEDTQADERQRLEALIDNLPVGVVSYRFDAAFEELRLLAANERADILLGIELRSRVGDRIQEIFPGIEQSEMFEICDRVARTGARVERTDTYYTADRGRGIYDAVFYRSGHREITLVFSEVTERVEAIQQAQKMREAATRNERRFRAIFENAPVMINSFTDTGECVLWNRECERQLGYSIDDVRALDSPLAAFYPDPAQKNAVLEAIRMADGTFRDYQVRAKSGESRRQRWADFALPDGSRISVGYDDTELRRSFDLLQAAEADLRRTNAELERSNRELEQFAYVVSHDLNEPLRMITGFIGRLDKRYADSLDDDGRKFMQYVVDGARRMQTMLDDILSLSRMNQRERTYQFESLDEVLDEAISVLDVEVRDAVVRPARLPQVFGDFGQLVRMFVNLLSNAHKFRSERPLRIEVLVDKQSAGYVVSIADNGVGFEAKHADRMFRMFDRLHPAQSYEGSGIGLAVVAKIAGLHGGKVWAEGREGRGATFFVEFPRVEGRD